MHPATAQRITDSTRYGNTYPLNAVMTDLTDAIFPSTKSLTTTSRNLQIEYVKRLISMTGLVTESAFDNVARTTAFAQLERVAAMRAPRRSDFELVAHYDYMKRMIDNAITQ